MLVLVGAHRGGSKGQEADIPKLNQCSTSKTTFKHIFHLSFEHLFQPGGSKGQNADLPTRKQLLSSKHIFKLNNLFKLKSMCERRNAEPVGGPFWC